MRRARKLLALPAADRWLLLQAALLVVAVQFGLWLLPFRVVRRALGRKTWFVRKPRSPMNIAPERVGWAVAVASQYVPASTCLVQALAAKGLLARIGYAAELRIGVAKNAGGRLEAHAWLEHNGCVLIGGNQDLARYTLLPAWDSAMHGEMSR
jgi:hypothetical protein